MGRLPLHRVLFKVKIFLKRRCGLLFLFFPLLQVSHQKLVCGRGRRKVLPFSARDTGLLRDNALPRLEQSRKHVGLAVVRCCELHVEGFAPNGWALCEVGLKSFSHVFFLPLILSFPSQSSFGVVKRTTNLGGFRLFFVLKFRFMNFQSTK